MAKSKSGKLNLSLLKICRPKNPCSMVKPPPQQVLSPLNSKSFNISFPATPVPPPSTPSDAPTKHKPMSKKWNKEGEEKEVMVEESLVVVKKSLNPYEDFKKSMSEMIVAKQILHPKELEHLLMTFLSLNSTMHHKVIIQAFTHIFNQL
ncbi:transcription repressor OFP7-like [Salvia splendens]|uniref:transcription repressor OFP7-like n=1 Tax=Salvia splendens TaxID=180675 RepID=UPI001C25A497|nr:transcription repressor OFP7-like [Salvia splendens]